MRELWPFIVLIVFYFGTLIWTEWLFPEKDKRQQELKFGGEKKQVEPGEMMSASAAKH